MHLQACVAASDEQAQLILDLFEWFSTFEDSQTLADKIAEAGAVLGGYGAALLSLALPEGAVLGNYNLSEAEMDHFRAKARGAPIEERRARRRRLREQAIPGTGIAYVRHATESDWNALPSPPGRCREGTWDPRDTLYVLMRGRGGEDVGVLSLDAPLDGMAPTEKDLERLGLVERLAGVASNLLETRLYHEGLHRSEARFHALVEQAGDAIFLVARDGRILHANPWACASLGHAPEAMCSMHLRDFVVDFEDAHLDATWERSAARPATVPGRHRRKDGTTYPVEVRYARIQLEGEPALVAFARNVEERQLMEMRLRHTQKMDALGRLAGGLAHDFNNLLTVILGSCDVALHKCGAGGPGAELRVIRSAAEDASHLTDQLLDFGRERAEVTRPIDVRDAVEASAPLLRSLLGRGVPLEMAMPLEACRIEADPSTIGRILLNLAANARDAIAEQGTVTVTVRSGAEVVVLEVVDDGAGMDDATQARLFEPFFSTKGDHGTGLGLAAVYGMVDRCGGTIEVTSEPGAGTTFRLSFPRVP